MSARSVCSGSRPCRYHSFRAISAPFKRPATRTFMPLQPKRSAESTALRIARRKATRFSSCNAIDSDELRIEFRTVHFLNIDMHLALGALLHFLLELIDFRAFAANDDARARGIDAHDELVGGALDIDRADARAFELLFQLAAQLHVFVKKIGVVAVGVPARFPRLVVAEAKPVRVCLLSHYFFPFFDGVRLPVKALRTRRIVPRAPFWASASAKFVATRSAAATWCSATPTHKCAVRFW